MTGQTQDALAAIRHYVHQISDMVGNLTERQQHALATALLLYAASQRSHDPAIRTRRLRRHWGPARLAAARVRQESR